MTGALLLVMFHEIQTVHVGVLDGSVHFTQKHSRKCVMTSEDCLKGLLHGLWWVGRVKKWNICINVNQNNFNVWECKAKSLWLTWWYLFSVSDIWSWRLWARSPGPCHACTCTQTCTDPTYHSLGSNKFVQICVQITMRSLWTFLGDKRRLCWWRSQKATGMVQTKQIMSTKSLCTVVS